MGDSDIDIIEHTNVDGLAAKRVTVVGETNIVSALKAIWLAISNPSTTNKATNRVLVTADSVTFAANQDLRTLTNLTNIDSYQGKVLMVGQSITAWANCVRPRIT